MCAVPAYHKWVEEFEPLMKSVVKAVEGKKLIYGDNLYMYGDVSTEAIHETLPYLARTRKGKIRKKTGNHVT